MSRATCVRPMIGPTVKKKRRPVRSLIAPMMGDSESSMIKNVTEISPTYMFEMG